MSKYKVTKASDEGYVDLAEGVRRKTVVYGERTLMIEVGLAKGKSLPLHDHPHEQTGYLISGCIYLVVDGQKNEIRKGDSWSIPGGVPHSAEAVEDSVAIEVFSPVREDYLPDSAN